MTRFRVIDSFFGSSEGDSVLMEVGKIVEYENPREYLSLLMNGRIFPHDMPDFDKYLVRRSCSYSTGEKIVSLNKDEIITLAKEISVSLMLDRFVIPINEKAFYPYRIEE